MSEHIGHIVVQTHWDREWYYTREQYLARLLRAAPIFLEGLEQGDLETMLFDGQTIAIEDVLGACEPGIAQRLRAMVAADRLIIGPWYVAADEFLSAGEGLIRNLERGIEAAIALGNCQKIGYLPDTFGHIAQMPQILQGFGIGTAVLWRGCDLPHSECQWRAPDGSTVFTLVLTQGYYQHPFNVTEWKTAVPAYFDAVAPAALTQHLLLTQGGDHLVPVSGLRDKIAALNAENPLLQLRQARLDGYIAEVQVAVPADLPVIAGELRQNGRAFVLPDILSTRRYLKLAHQQAEDRLIGAIEPLLAVALSRDHYPATYLRQSWDILLQQQAHDSLCGCSIDAVHDEMLIRYHNLSDRLDALTQSAGRALGMVGDQAAGAGTPGPFADHSRCSLFNPSVKPFSGWLEAEIFLAGPKQEALLATAADGARMRLAILESMPKPRFISPLDDFPDHVAGHVYRVAIEARIPALDFMPIVIEPAETMGQVALSTPVISNTALEAGVTGEGFYLVEHATGQRYEDVFSFESVLDAGDSYNFSPPPQQKCSRARLSSVQAFAGPDGVQTLVVCLHLEQPCGLDADRQGPDARPVISEGTLTLKLYPDETMLRVALHWTNRACDHRLRLLLPLPAPIAMTLADSAFALVDRAVIHAAYPATPSRQEAPVAVNPSHSLVCAGPYAVTHRALNEFEIEQTAEGERLALTLLRCVGWMSRRDLVSRGVGAGPDMPTPGAQCLGAHAYEFALRLDGARTDPADLLDWAASWRRPPLLLQGHPAAKPVIPPVAIQMPSPLQLSSLRWTPDGLELRLWNPTGSVQPVSIAGWTARPVDFLRQPCSRRPDTSIGPHAIQTFMIVPVTDADSAK